MGFRRRLCLSVASVSAIAAVHLSSSRSLSPDYSTRRPPTLPLLSFEVEFFFFFFSLGVCLFGSSLGLSEAEKLEKRRGIRNA